MKSGSVFENYGYYYSYSYPELRRPVLYASAPQKFFSTFHVNCRRKESVRESLDPEVDLSTSRKEPV